MSENKCKEEEEGKKKTVIYKKGSFEEKRAASRKKGTFICQKGTLIVPLNFYCFPEFSPREKNPFIFSKRAESPKRGCTFCLNLGLYEELMMDTSKLFFYAWGLTFLILGV